MDEVGVATLDRGDADIETGFDVPSYGTGTSTAISSQSDMQVPDPQAMQTWVKAH